MVLSETEDGVRSQGNLSPASDSAIKPHQSPDPPQTSGRQPLDHAEPDVAAPIHESRSDQIAEHAVARPGEAVETAYPSIAPEPDRPCPVLEQNPDRIPGETIVGGEGLPVAH